jgi:hypothetical protein
MKLKTKWFKRVCSLCAAKLSTIVHVTLNATIECMREQHARLPCAVSATDTGWLIRSHLVEQMLWLGAGHCCLGGYRQGVCNIHTVTRTLTDWCCCQCMGCSCHTCMHVRGQCCFTTHACLPYMLLQHQQPLHFWHSLVSRVRTYTCTAE